MSDLAKRLRQWAGSYEEGSFDTEADLMGAAADEIDRLREALRVYAQSLRGSHATRNDIANELDALAKDAGQPRSAWSPGPGYKIGDTCQSADGTIWHCVGVDGLTAKLERVVRAKEVGK